jgi:putative acyl-CoA dehydrogenase
MGEVSFGHSSANQSPPFEGRNLFTIDAALHAAVEHSEALFAMPALTRWGEVMGSAETYGLADAANRNPPQLRTHDRQGERIDDITFHPAWHTLMQRSMEAGEHCAPWRERRRGAQVARAAMYYLHAQVENGTQCPLTMTYASLPVLERHAGSLPPFVEALRRAITNTAYDPRPLPVEAKHSALIGMGMTERQGGSDVRANATRAEHHVDDTWRIHGHKWFFSAPQCDAHLVLAQSGQGLGCFLMPRLAPDGTRNRIRVNRLKDKLGNRSNASAEVEFDGAVAFALGAPDRGVATILEMVQYTRLDCVIGSAGIMRAAVAWAIHHARHRRTFGRALVDHPLMTNVLADLAIEGETALLLAMFLARAVEHDADPALRSAARVVTPAAKYWVCKRAIATVAEAMEVLGGNGYIEETPLARFYREAPVNSIWEGSGNIVCLDVVRAIRHVPDAAEALLACLARARGSDRRFDAACDRLQLMLENVGDEQASARRIAQAIALAVAGAEIIQVAPNAIVDAFLGSRLGADGFTGAAFGNLPASCDAPSIVARALAA